MFPSIHPDSAYPREIRLLERLSLSLLVVSAVALATLYALHRYKVISQKLSQVVCFAPISATAGLGGALGVSSLILRMQKKSPKPTSQAAKSKPSWVDSNTYTKPKPIACFELINDFLGLDIKDSSNYTNALSFLVQGLEDLEKCPFIESPQTVSLLRRRLALTYLFNTKIDSLRSASDYKQQRGEIVKEMAFKLKEEGVLLLPSGYYASIRGGHAILVELTYSSEDEKVEGRVINRGEGSQYHFQSLSQKRKYFSLILKETPFDSLLSSGFLEVLIDLEQGDLDYAVEDFYDNLLPLWPNKITYNASEKPRSAQRAGTCSYKPFIGYLKEILGPTDGGNAKLWLEIRAFNAFLDASDFSNIDWRRVKDALEKLHREAVKRKRSKTLAPVLEADLASLVERVASSAPPKSTAERVEVSGWREETQEGIFPFSRKADSSSFKRLSKAKPSRMKFETLEEIPALQDSVWNTPLSPDLLHHIKVLMNQDVDRAQYTPGRVMDYLKTVTLIFKQATLHPEKIDREVLEFYASQLLLSIQRVAHLCAFTHPSRVEIFRECLRILRPFYREGYKPLSLDSRGGDLLDVKIDCLKTLLKNVELKWLYRICIEYNIELKRQVKVDRWEGIEEEVRLVLKIWKEGFDQEPLFLQNWRALRELFYSFQAITLGGCERVGAPIHIIEAVFHRVQEGFLNLKIYPVGLDPKKSPEMVHTFYRTENKEHRDYIKAILNPLRPLFGKPRSTQNQHLLLQEGVKGMLTVRQQQELLAAFPYDKLRIAQLLFFFENHFAKLRDPKCRALFSMILFGLNSKRTDSILAEGLFEPNNLMAHYLFSFLQRAHQRSVQLGWLDVTLFITRHFARAWSFLPPGEIRKNQLEYLYNEIIDKLSLKSDDVRQTLLSIASYIPPNQHILRAPTQVVKSSPPQMQVIEEIEKGLRALEKGEGEICLLPKSITKDSSFTRRFGYYRTLQAQRVIKDQDFFEFYDEKGEGYRILCTGYRAGEGFLSPDSDDFLSLVFYKKIQNVWWEEYQLSRLDRRREDFAQQHGIFSSDDYHLWAHPEKDLAFALSVLDSTLLFRITSEGLCHPHLPLRLAREYSSFILERVEKIPHTLIWKDPENQIQRIELPRRGLTFLLRHNRWYLEDQPGFYLSETQNIEQLRAINSYLVVENRWGKKVALIPTFSYASKKQRGFSKPSFEPETREVSSQCLKIPLSASGALQIPENGEAHAYLIYLAMRTYDYGWAKELIAPLFQQKPDLSGEAREWLESLTYEKTDRHPHAIALRLHLHIFLGTDPEEDYSDYLDRERHTFGYRVTREQETRLLASASNFDSGEGKKLLKTRQAQLSESPPGAIESWVSEPDGIKKNIPHGFFLGQSRDKWIKHINTPYPDELDTRLALQTNFLHYYNILRHSGKKSPEYQALLRKMRSSKPHNELSAYLFNFLLALVNSKEREKFPSINDCVESESLDKLLAPLQSHSNIFFSNFRYDWSFNGRVDLGRMSQARIALRSQVIATSARDAAQLPSKVLIQRTKRYAALHKLHRAKELDKKDLQQIQKSEGPVRAAILTHLTKEEPSSPAIAFQNEKLVLGLQSGRGSREEIQRQFEEKSTAIKKGILELAHHYPASLRLEKEGAMLPELTFEQLLIYVGIGDEASILDANPSLHRRDIALIKERVIDYAILETDRQLLERKGPLMPRTYDPHTEPHLVVFELFGNIRLRPKQYKGLKRLTKTPYESIDFEAPTGFGKSSVLIPLWLYMHGNEQGNIAMMALPKSLFHAQLKKLRKMLGSAFNTVVLPIFFDRDRGNDLPYLEKLAKKLENTEKKNRVLLINIQDFHSITSLKLKEALHRKYEDDPTLLVVLERIRTTIEEKATVFFDESKECFDIRRRYDYAVGGQAQIGKVPIAIASDLYSTLFLDPAYFLEFLPHTLGRPILDPKNYERELLPELAEQVTKRLEVPANYQRAVLQDLQGAYSQGVESYYSSLSEEKLLEYATLRKHLTVHIPRALFKKAGDSYGLEPGTRFVIPYHDGVPRLSSEFSEIEDLINFTIQANLKYPFGLNEIQEVIDRLRVQYFSQPRAFWEQSETYPFLCSLLDDPERLFDLKQKDIVSLTEKINIDLHLKLDFIKHFILSKLKVYRGKVASTPFNLVQVPRHVQSASGTIASEILPPRMRAIEDPEALIPNLTSIWEMSELKSLGDAELHSLALLYPNSRVIIDAGGLFRDLDLQETATTLLACKGEEVKGVLLYDPDGRELIFERETGMLMPRENSFLDLEDLFIFLRKSKSVGTDIVMPEMFEATVTVDRETPKDLLFQAIGRMRGLSKGQKVHFACLKIDEPIFKDEPSFAGILKQATHVQGTQRGQDAFYALYLHMKDLIESIFWKQESKTPELFALFSDFLLEPTLTSPLDFLRKSQREMSAKEAVDSIKAKYFSMIREAPEALQKLIDLSALEKEFDTYVDFRKLPATLRLNQSAPESIVESESKKTIFQMESTNTVEATEEVASAQSEVLAEQDEEDLSNSLLNPIHFKPAPPLDWDGDYKALIREKPHKKALGVEIYFSPNFCRVSESAKENRLAQKPAYQWLFYCEGQKHKILLLDLHDANQVFEHLQKASLSPNEGAYLYSGNALIACKSSYLNAPLSARETLLAKLYRGGAPVTEDELQILRGEERQQFFALASELLPVWPGLQRFLDELIESSRASTDAKGRAEQSP